MRAKGKEILFRARNRAGAEEKKSREGIALRSTAPRSSFVPGTGIEPALPCENQILSLARLPIPPSGQSQ